MAQYGGSPFGHPGHPQHRHPQQQQQPQPFQAGAPAQSTRQRPPQQPHAFSYGAPNPSPAPQFHSQPAPRPFPGATPSAVPMSAPQNQPQQQFYQGHEYPQRPQQPGQGHEYPQRPQQPGHGFNTPNPSFQAPASNQPTGPHARPSHSQPQQPDFVNQFAQNPMAGLAMNTAQDFLTKQSALYLPGAYGIWGNVKYYFMVNNSYVKSRLKILLLPFWHRNWRRMGTGESDENKPTQYAPPSRDINAPDLYIPLMGFLTYILIVGYTKGTSNQFSPDVIGKDASYCLVMQLVEIGILAACLYLLNSSISFLDLVSFSGYKYIPLVINAIVYQILGSVAYYLALLYTGIAVSFFTLNCMKGSVSEPTQENRAFRNYLLFGVSCLQLILVCWISYTTAPHE